MKVTFPAWAGAAIASGALAAGIAVAVAIPAAASTAARGSAAAAVTDTAAAQALQPWPVLRQGPNSQWPRVTVPSLQYLLNARGARLAVDGAFGPKTKAAVVRFQHSRHLTGDGVVGAGTWRALIVTVQRGSTGPAVRAVQDQINFRNLRNGHTLNVDGIFGPNTALAVRAFQRAMASEIPGFGWTASSARGPGQHWSPRRCRADPNTGHDGSGAVGGRRRQDHGPAGPGQCVQAQADHRERGEGSALAVLTARERDILAVLTYIQERMRNSWPS